MPTLAFVQAGFLIPNLELFSDYLGGARWPGVGTSTGARRQTVSGQRMRCCQTGAAWLLNIALDPEISPAHVLGPPSGAATTCRVSRPLTCECVAVQLGAP